MTSKKTSINLKHLGILLVTLLIPSLSFAGNRDDRSIEIQGFVTLLLGPGVSLAYNLGDHLAFGGNYYVASIEGDGEDEENVDAVKADFSTSEVFIRLYPFERTGFYISGASVVRNWKITVTGKEDIGDSGVEANYELTAKWPNTGYAYGVGYNGTAKFGLSGGVFLGALSGGDPELSGTVDNDAISQADIDKEVDEIEEEEEFGKKYNTVPLVRISIGFNF